MKLAPIVLSAILALASNSISAQNFQGIATYQTAGSVKMEFDSKKMPPEQQERIKSMMSKAMQKEFELFFDKSASVFKEVESLEKGGHGRMAMMGSMNGLGGVFFKNVQNQSEIRESEFFGKPFLIKDSLTGFDWKLGKETKQIGNYTCYKATYEREGKIRSFSMGGEGEQDSTITVVVTAWYTPQIPVSQGPDKYWGLPGLIMEITDGQTVMLCTKVVLNPTEKVAIVEPEKGEEVTRAEFKEIMEKKMAEMREMYGGQGRGGGMKIMIQD